MVTDVVSSAIISMSVSMAERPSSLQRRNLAQYSTGNVGIQQEGSDRRNRLTVWQMTVSGRTLEA